MECLCIFPMKSLTTLLALIAVVTTLQAAEPKKVVVCTITYGYRHDSIPFAEQTLQKLADQSQAFKIVEMLQQSTLPRIRKPSPPKKPDELKPDADEKAEENHQGELKKFAEEQRIYEEAIAKWPADGDRKMIDAEAAWNAAQKLTMAKLSPENLKAQGIDGVIFANTTGDLPLPDREGFIKWIEEGRSFMAIHSASDTFHGFPGYLDMLQGEFDGHDYQVPADLIAGDVAHPANGGIGATWNLTQEEMYRIKHHDRSKVRSLWFLRHDPTFANKPGYSPISWCRKAGEGRVFYTALGHREDLWSDDPTLKDRKNSVEISKQYQAHLLGGIKWALGLAEGSVEPNPEVK